MERQQLTDLFSINPIMLNQLFGDEPSPLHVRFQAASSPQSLLPIMPQTLILQSPHLARAALPISRHYFDLPATLPNDILRLPTHGDYPRLPAAAAAEFQQQQIDYALIPDTLFAALKLVVSDMDSTLITIECIDEIAASAGLKDQIAEITERAMQGELDFEQSLRHRVALLQGQPENRLAEVYEHKLQLAQGAEEFIRDCQAHGIRFLLVSGGFTYFTDRLQSRLGLDWAFANQLEIINGRLTGKVLGRVIDAQAKADLLNQHRQALGATRGQVLAIGDGANDIPMLQAAGFGIAYHAKPKTQAAVSIAISHHGWEAVRRLFT